MLTSASGAESEICKMRRWIGLFILCIVAFIGFTSQALLSILVQPIKADLGITDTQFGLITGLVISTVGALAAFPIGMMADRYGRLRILAISILTWSAATVVMGLAQNTAMFTVGAMAINLGDAALLPLLYAMIPQIFGERERHFANTILVTVLMLGAYAVYWLGGVLLHSLDGGVLAGLAAWRAVCLVVALVGALVTLGLVIVPRGEPNDAPRLSTESMKDEPFIAFLRREGTTVLWLYLGMSFFYIAWTTFSFWYPAILERSFGLNSADANSAIGQPLILAAAAGLLLAMFILKIFVPRWGDGAPVHINILGCTLGFVPVLAMPFAASMTLYLICLSLFTAAMTICMSVAPSLLQGCAPARFRSRTIALFPIVVLGTRIIFPAIVGYLSDQYPNSPRALLNINVGMMLVCIPISIAIFVKILPRYTDLAGRVKAEDAHTRASAAA
jgi:MFS family permease